MAKNGLNDLLLIEKTQCAFVDHVGVWFHYLLRSNRWGCFNLPKSLLFMISSYQIFINHFLLTIIPDVKLHELFQLGIFSSSYHLEDWGNFQSFYPPKLEKIETLHPPKINGWNLKIPPLEKETYRPKPPILGFQPLILEGVNLGNNTLKWSPEHKDVAFIVIHIESLGVLFPSWFLAGVFFNAMDSSRFGIGWWRKKR